MTKLIISRNQFLIKPNIKALLFIVIAALPALFFGSSSAQIVEKPKKVMPIKLEAMIPKFDKSKPKSKKLLKGGVSDIYNPDVLVIPKSGSNKAYEVGLQLYNDGDYKRALNAFKLAMIRGAKYGLNDPRVINAKKAIKSAESRLNMQAKLGYKTDNSNHNALTGKVEKVFKPSLAWLGGLEKDDLIIKAKVQQSLVYLTVKRNGKIYHLKLKLKKQSSINLKPMVAKKDGRKRRSPKQALMTGKIKNPVVLTKNEGLLARYDCALLVDNSGSMSSPIRVNIGTNLLDSKWGWCQQNSEKFYNDVSRYFPNGLMLVPFNNRFAVARNAKRPEIHEVFTKLHPHGGTNIAAPLAFVLDDYFERRSRNSRVKPLAIAVMTDGQDSFNKIRDVVIDATSRMKHGREIKITFLSIGNVNFGSPVLTALDEDLVDAGAAYDIVDTRYFDEIIKYGLKKMIVAALVEAKAEKK